MSYARPLFSSGSGSGSGAQGATGANGEAGGNGGLPLYLNYSQTSPAFGSYKYLSSQQVISGSTQSYAAGATQTFLTNFTFQNTVPAGIYTLNLFAKAPSGAADISFNLAVINSIGTVFSTIATSNPAALSSTSLTTLSITAVGTSFTLSAGYQVLLTIKISGNPVDINYQYNNGNGYSYLQTTFTPPGVTGPQGAVGSTGAQGTPYWSLTGNQLYPTTLTNNVGIGTQGVTGALDVSGNLHTNADAYINGVRVGRGGGNINNNIVVGSNSLNNNTIGAYNTALGINSLASNIDGSFNIAIGFDSLASNTSGENNTSIGANSLLTNTTGRYNVAIGNNSLAANIIGNNNTAIGINSLLVNTVDSNTAIGAYSLENNTIGNNNTAVGSRSLIYNTTGINNTAIGRASLQTNILGSYNTAVGYNSLYSNVDGSFNTAIGDGSLQNNNNGVDNVAVGHVSLQSNTTGPYNTAIGSGSLRENISGSDNTAIGHVSLYANTTGKFNTAIGSASLGNNTVDGNTAIGAYSLQFNTSGQNNTAVGYNSGVDLSGNSNYNTLLGFQSNVDSSLNIYNNSTAVGYNSIIDASNQIVLGGLNVSSSYPGVKIPGSYVGIGGVYNPASGYALDVSGVLHTNADALINEVTVGTGGGNNNTNTAVGSFALYKNTDGSSNTAVGSFALYKNTDGYSNIALGSGALYNNIDGNENTAVGVASLQNIQSGNDNVGIGVLAFGYKSSGNFNIAVGANAGIYDISGNNNTFIGYQADVSNNYGTPYDIYSYSTALGYGSIIDDSYEIVLGTLNERIKIPGSYVGINGVYNPASGYALDVSGVLHTNADALINEVTVGTGGGNISSNTAVGYQALQANTTGQQNTAIGNQTLFSNDTGSDNVAISYQALNLNTIGENNIAIGTTSLYNNIDGSFNTAIGANSGYRNISGNYNTFLGYQSDIVNSGVPYGTYNNSTAIGYNSIIDASNQIVFGTSNESVKIPGSYVGIGVYNPPSGHRLDVSGSVNATSYNTSSDYRIKKDVITLGETFTVDNLNPVTYNNISLGKQDIGLIAHELQEIYPFLVTGEKDGENFQSVNYTGIIGILIKEIQELKKDVKILKENIHL